MITNEYVNKAIDYILAHIGEDLSVDQVAEHCNFSKYFFTRMFKIETGESIGEFIRRAKMEQSAFRLKVERGRSITDVGGDYGYSSSNYSSAFKQHHEQSPIEFRRGPDYHVIYHRHKGSYVDLSEHWGEFQEKYGAYITADTLFLERTYNDPSITNTSGCLYDLYMTVQENCALPNTAEIKGGKYAVYHFKGPVKQIYTAYQNIFNVWLPESGHKIDERYSYDIYRAIDCDSMNMEIEICTTGRE